MGDYLYVKNQAIGKSIWRMPRQSEAKKDVIHCEKPWGAVNSIDPRMSEWGNPAARSLSHEYIVQKERTQGTETSKYL